MLSSNCICIKLGVQNHIPGVHRRNAIRNWAQRASTRLQRLHNSNGKEDPKGEEVQSWEIKSELQIQFAHKVKKKANKNEIFHLTGFIKVSLNKGLFKVAAVTKPVSDCTEPADPTRRWTPKLVGGILRRFGNSRWFSSVVLQTKYHKCDQDV